MTDAPTAQDQACLPHRDPRRVAAAPARPRPLPWIGPALLLIFGVVLWPAFEMLRTSVLDISMSGVSRGFAGLDNFEQLFANPDLPEHPHADDHLGGGGGRASPSSSRWVWRRC